MPKADYLFEVSWEVCNKVGGIYTVVKSKAARIVDYYHRNYFLIGPYFANKALGQFQEELTPEPFKKISEDLGKEGIVCHYGKWLIEGSPNVILIDFAKWMDKTNDIKRLMWDWYNVDSLRTGLDYNEPLTWSFAVGKLLERIKDVLKDERIVAQFHEWLSGSVLLYLKKNNVKIATVFTTHATVLGRTLASSNVDLYSKGKNGRSAIESKDLEREAYNYFVEAKHQIEKASAQLADVFTTVSEITAIEASVILKRKAEVLLLNGLDLAKFPTFEEISIKHRIMRDKIREFLLYYFFPYYTFDIKETLIYFLAGRYEFHDKGIDIFIKALGRLNQKMKGKLNKTVAAFIWVPANIRGIKAELLESKTFYEDIKDSVEENIDDIKKNILYALAAKEDLSKKNLFDEEFLFEIKKKVMMLNKKGNPPLSTHDLMDENDEIMRHIKEAGLNNSKDDPVKIIFYPIYLSGADGLLDLNYYESMQGSHLGVFPSFYEPWGYTPLEAGALGVSSVTTDLAGFGRYILRIHKKARHQGIFVLNRLGRKDEEVVKELAERMYDYAALSAQDRIANKIHARHLSSHADWKFLIKNYIKAHDMAVEKIWK